MESVTKAIALGPTRAGGGPLIPVAGLGRHCRYWAGRVTRSLRLSHAVGDAANEFHGSLIGSALDACSKALRLHGMIDRAELVSASPDLWRTRKSRGEHDSATSRENMVSWLSKSLWEEANYIAL